VREEFIGNRRKMELFSSLTDTESQILKPSNYMSRYKRQTIPITVNTISNSVLISNYSLALKLRSNIIEDLKILIGYRQDIRIC